MAVMAQRTQLALPVQNVNKLSPRFRNLDFLLFSRDLWNKGLLQCLVEVIVPKPFLNRLTMKKTAATMAMPTVRTPAQIPRIHSAVFKPASDTAMILLPGKSTCLRFEANVKIYQAQLSSKGHRSISVQNTIREYVCCKATLIPGSFLFRGSAFTFHWTSDISRLMKVGLMRSAAQWV